MKGMKRVFWIAFAVFAVCMTQVAAVLYAGVPQMTDEGFLHFSPELDVAVYGVPMIVAGIVALCCEPRENIKIQVPQAWRYPVSYAATQVLLTGLVLIMGLLQILHRYSPIRLPIYGYAIGLSVAYLAAGFLWGRRYGGSIPVALISFGVLVGVMSLLAGTRLAEIEKYIAELVAEYPDLFINTNLTVGSTDWVMDTWQGQGLALLNLPGCVLMGHYGWDHNDLDHEIPRTVITWLVTVVPVTLFTGAWLVGRKTKK